MAAGGAVFGQNGWRVSSFDAGFGINYRPVWWARSASRDSRATGRGRPA